MLFLALALCIVSQRADAHFSYSDPRIVHVAEQDDDRAVILIRMPAPLVLLPNDWRGTEEARLPPFAVVDGGETVLDLAAVAEKDVALRTRLTEAISLWVAGSRVETQVEQVRFWADEARPGFGTLKSARAAFDKPSETSAAALPYFNLTVDVMILAPTGMHGHELRLESSLGRNFQVMEKFGTVVKLHRNGATETKAIVGVLDVSFPAVQNQWQILLDAGLLGAEHIYLGLDHLALIVLIAIAALHWRQALAWASTFTLGHMITLAAGLYGFSPSSVWFVPFVEVAIAISVVAAGVAVFLRRTHAFGWLSLLVVGLIHGFGFAASASEALFAGQFDPMVLVAFAVGLEFCQFAIYALAMPLILLIDHTISQSRVSWRRTAALGIAAWAVSAAILRLTEATSAFGVA